MYLMYGTFFMSICYLSLAQENEEYNDCRPVYTHNYGYKLFFHLPNSSIISNSSIYFPFSVQASSDAHILFSTNVNPKDTEPMYEVVLGAGWNSYSEIRRLHQNRNRTSQPSRGVLNKNFVKKFWVKIDNGKISMGEGNTTKPIIEWKDQSPLKINYISLSSWHGTNAKWYFDCWGATPVAQNKTLSDKLRSDLFDKYDPYTVPIVEDDNPVTVYSNLSINYVNLEPVTSSLELIGYLKTSWEDNSLKWLPSNYEDIEIIRIKDRKIWQPAFLLFNGITLKQTWFEQGVVTITYEGIVEWKSPIHLITRCNVKMKDWPRDQHTCGVTIGLYSDQESIQLDGLQEVTLESGSNAGIWEISSVGKNLGYVIPPWTEILDDNMNETDVSPVLSLEITLQRCSSMHYYLFYVPLKVIMSISIISCCLPYTCSQRIMMQVLVLINSLIHLLSIDSILPSVITETPHILSLSSGTLMVATVCTILTVWLIQCSQSSQYVSVPYILDEFITFLSMRFNLFTSTGGRKLLTSDSDEECSSMKINSISGIQKKHAYFTILDYLLLISVTISYLILLFVHKEIY